MVCNISWSLLPTGMRIPLRDKIYPHQHLPNSFDLPQSPTTPPPITNPPSHTHLSKCSNPSNSRPSKSPKTPFQSEINSHSTHTQNSPVSAANSKTWCWNNKMTFYAHVSMPAELHRSISILENHSMTHIRLRRLRFCQSVCTHPRGGYPLLPLLYTKHSPAVFLLLHVAANGCIWDTNTHGLSHNEHISMYRCEILHDTVVCTWWIRIQG